MKAFYILILLATTTYWSTAQSTAHTAHTKTEGKSVLGHLPVLNSQQTWISLASTGFEPPSSFQYTYSDDSILIDSHYYFERIQSNYEDNSDTYVEGYYREEEGKIYKKSEIEAEEALILDMGLIVGDTIHIDQPGFSSSHVVVAVDTLEYLDGMARKQIELKCAHFPEDFGSRFWIEGIGELYSGIFCVLDGGSDYIRCVLDADGERIYSNIAEDVNCWLTTRVDDFAATRIRVFPNPATDDITIDGLSDPLTWVSIYNTGGQLILNSIAGPIDVSSLPSGLYIIKLIDSNHNTLTSKFAKVD